MEKLKLRYGRVEARKHTFIARQERETDTQR